MSEFKEYVTTYQHVHTGDQIKHLRVLLKTAEFGDMASEMTKATGNDEIDRKVMEAQAEDLIDAYEKRLNTRKIMVGAS